MFVSVLCVKKKNICKNESQTSKHTAVEMTEWRFLALFYIVKILNYLNVYSEHSLLQELEKVELFSFQVRNSVGSYSLYSTCVLSKILGQTVILRGVPIDTFQSSCKSCLFSVCVHSNEGNIVSSYSENHKGQEQIICIMYLLELLYYAHQVLDVFGVNIVCDALVQTSGFQRVVLGPEAPGNLLKNEILKLHHRPTESEMAASYPQNLCFNKHSMGTEVWEPLLWYIEGKAFNQVKFYYKLIFPLESMREFINNDQKVNC